MPALSHRVVLASTGGGMGELTGARREEAERVLNSLLERIPIP